MLAPCLDGKDWENQPVWVKKGRYGTGVEGRGRGERVMKEGVEEGVECHSDNNTAAAL